MGHVSTVLKSFLSFLKSSIPKSHQFSVSCHDMGWLVSSRSRMIGHSPLTYVFNLPIIHFYHSFSPVYQLHPRRCLARPSHHKNQLQSSIRIAPGKLEFNLWFSVPGLSPLTISRPSNKSLHTRRSIPQCQTPRSPQRFYHRTEVPSAALHPRWTLYPMRP